VQPLLEKLREMLPPEMDIWAGGAGVERIGATEGVRLITDLAQAVAALADWRENRPAD